MNTLNEINTEKTLKGETQSNSLDVLERNSNTVETSAPCKAGLYILSGSALENGLHPHYRTFCKSYRCEYCGPRKVYLVQRCIAVAIKEFNLRVFATLTLSQNGLNPNDSIKYIRNVWNKFRILQKRHFQKNVDFVCVLELQGSGHAHLHILFSDYIPHAWLKSAWQSVGGGKIVDVRKADGGASRYMAKYLSKSLQSDQMSNSRKISTSQTIRLMKLIEKMEKKNEFYFCKVSELEARHILEKYIVDNIVDKKGFIQGFNARKQLPKHFSNNERT